MAVRDEIFSFRRTAAVLTGYRLSDNIPSDGNVERIQVHYPDGCDGNVKVKVGHGSVQLLPRDGDLALNDITYIETFEDEYAKKSEALWVEIRNGDSANTHTISVEVKFKRDKSPYPSVR